MPKRPPRGDEEQQWRRMFGGRLRLVREDELQLSQSELSNQLGYTTSAWLSDIERGVNGIDVYPFWRIIQMTGYPCDYFLNPNFDSAAIRLPQTRVEWERFFPGERERAAAHWELDQIFRRHPAQT